MNTNRPKKIHYCWFGGAPKPAIVNTCIASWKKYMPEYEIVEWNEQNYDIKKSEWMKEAYNEKKWAFVSDYARFDIIYHYGGIYLDTDVELLKKIPVEILNNDNFTAFESAGKVNPGLIYADVQGGKITKEFLKKYDDMHFIINGKPILVTVNSITTDILLPKGLTLNNQKQTVDGLTVYPSSYFCGYDQDVREYAISSETISVHHYAGSWTQRSWKRKLGNIAKCLFGVENYRKLLHLYRRIRHEQFAHKQA